MNIKKTIKILSIALVIILITTVSLVAFIGCQSQTKPSKFLDQTNLAKNAVFTKSDGSVQKNKFFRGVEGDYIDINFGEPVTINTVALFAKGQSIEQFEIYKKTGDSFEFIYQQDYLDTMRYCTFLELETSVIRIKVTKASAEFLIKKVEIYRASTYREDFRVTYYTLVNDILEYTDIDINAYKNVTDVILFGYANFERDGVIYIEDKDLYKKAIDNLKKIEKQLGRDFTIYLNVLNPSVEGEDDLYNTKKSELTKEAMEDNKDKLAESVQSLVSLYGVDGIGFDYEYPYKQKYWNAFGGFLQYLKKENPQIKITCALAPWGNGLSSGAIKAIDSVQIMSYDLADYTKNHSPFYYQGPKAIDYFLSRGFQKSQLCLGLPFYGRPDDMGAVWTGYNADYKSLGRFGNVSMGNIGADGLPERKAITYNGYQMIMDKTAFAYDMMIGGIMIWHAACDIASTDPLALCNAIAEGIKSRQQ